MQTSVNRVSLSLSATCVVLSLASAGCPGWWQWQQDGSVPPLPAAGATTPPPLDAGVEPATPITDPVLPTVDGDCPTIETGEVRVGGVPVRLWLGEAPAGETIQIVIYWHGTGSSPVEAENLLGDTFSELTSSGGLIVALGGTTRIGESTSTDTWHTGDFAIVDQVVACAVKQLPIDTRRVYTTGCSAGAVHAGVMAYQRSGYIAAAALNSGGQVQPFALQEPGHVPNAITAHGPYGTDLVIIDYAQASEVYAKRLASEGGFAVDCGHTFGHCGASAELKGALWQFLKDHPFGVDPEPYAGGLPASFPAYCRVVGN